MKFTEYSLTTKVTLIATYTMMWVIVTVLGSLVYGLFDNRVSNSEIFEIIGPAFNTVIGAFVGVVAGIHMGKSYDS